MVDRTVDEINNKSGLRKKSIKVELTENAKEWILDNSDFENYGARNVKKVVNDEIKNVLAKEILYGDQLKSNSNVLVDLDDKGKLLFNF